MISNYTLHKGPSLATYLWLINTPMKARGISKCNHHISRQNTHPWTFQATVSTAHMWCSTCFTALDLTSDVHFTQEEADDAVHHGRGWDTAADERTVRRHLGSGKGFDLYRSGKSKNKPLIWTTTNPPWFPWMSTRLVFSSKIFVPSSPISWQEVFTSAFASNFNNCVWWHWQRMVQNTFFS